MFSRNSVSTPSPTWAERRPRGVEVLLIGLQHPADLCIRRADRARDLDPVATRAGDLERRDAEVAKHGVAARDRELGTYEDHVHRQPAAARPHEELLCGRQHLRRGLAGRIRLEERSESLGVDADGVADGLHLLVALHRAREIELDVERDDVDLAFERGEIANRHHVVESVDPDSPAGETFCEPLAGPVREHLLLDPAPAVLAHVPRLRREHDRRFAFARQDDVGVAMDDDEAGHVGHGALEPRVLGAADDHRLDAVLVHRSPHRAVAPLDLRGANGAAHHSLGTVSDTRTWLLRTRGESGLRAGPPNGVTVSSQLRHSLVTVSDTRPWSKVP